MSHESITSVKCTRTTKQEGEMALLFIFVGERRSRTAIRLGVSWRDGRLAAKTLAQALLRLGLSYDEHYAVLNAYHDPQPESLERQEDEEALAFCQQALLEGSTIVALGTQAHLALYRRSIPHTCLVHPAARGAIRARQAYYAHVQQTLGLPVCEESEYAVTPCSLRWHYPEQVPRVDESAHGTHPLSRSCGSPNGPMAGSASMLRRCRRAVNASPPPIRGHSGSA